ncbi:hypothetical protein [Streptomyces sp. FH025]|uniref:hypothetical protein n=1 Tax=Streptomyces sp. FH025 TaxID=2815937 RepID=UPI001A9D4829|nr:hypothetical protein [Streptomyces sp. FH025]MBO1415528.1 hypothetical protein [Streptomyces sp. FH025]
MTHRIARSIAGALVAVLAAIGLGAVASSATAVAAPRTVAASAAIPAAGSQAGGAGTVHRSVATEDGSAQHLAAKDGKKKSGFFAKLGKFLLVVVILIILFVILLIFGIVYLVKRIFSRR